MWGEREQQRKARMKSLLIGASASPKSRVSMRHPHKQNGLSGVEQVLATILCNFSTKELCSVLGMDRIGKDLVL